MADARAAEKLVGELAKTATERSSAANGKSPAEKEPVSARGRGRAEKTTVAAVRSGNSVAVATVTSSDQLKRIDDLALLIVSAPSGAKKAVQQELAKAAHFLPRLRSPANADLIPEVEIAVSALLLDPPNLEIAKAANGHVYWDLWRRSYTPAVRMLAGVAVLSYLLALLWLLAGAASGGIVLDIPFGSLVGPAIFGWLGSVASIVTRINKFRDVPNPLLVGATRPVLGAAFGIFIYLALTSGIVTFSQGITNEFYLALAFVAGFSERLVPDLISQFESDDAVSVSVGDGDAKAKAEAKA
jgi:hypothetical protein